MRVSANVPSSQLPLFGKNVSDLQEDIVVGEDAITGTLKYVADYSSAYGAGEDSGNYIVLHVETVDGATVKAELVGGVHGEVTLDSDNTIIFRVTSTSQKIKITVSKSNYPTVTRLYSLTGLTLAQS